MPRLSDTSPDVERRLYAVYRNMPAWRKMQLVTDSYVVARRMHEAGHRLRNPGDSAADINRAWATMTLGPGPWLDRMEFAAMSPPVEHVRPIRFVVDVLNGLKIPYAIGGSLASSVHGVSRHTLDADLAVEPFPGKEAGFVGRLPEAEYYVNVETVRDAVARRGSFNVLHLLTGFKIDFFVRKDRPFESAMLARRRPAPVFGVDAGLFDLVSPEDVVLLKLEWFRIGGEASEKQWTDITHVLKTQAGHLDDGYLDLWAGDLKVKDLLDRVREEL